MIKKNQRTEKQLLNDERLRNKLKIEDVKPIIIEEIVIPPPPVGNRVRTRKIFAPYDLI